MRWPTKPDGISGEKDRTWITAEDAGAKSWTFGGPNGPRWEYGSDYGELQFAERPRHQFEIVATLADDSEADAIMAAIIRTIGSQAPQGANRPERATAERLSRLAALLAELPPEAELLRLADAVEKVRGVGKARGSHTGHAQRRRAQAMHAGRQR